MLMKIRNLNLWAAGFAVIMAIAMSCSGGAVKKKGEARVEYYRSILFSETPYDLEKGTHPVSADDARTINSYKFTWDDSSRLVSVEYVRNGILLGYSSLRGAAKVVYKYQGDKQIKNFFDKDNNPVESEGVFTAEYTLDTNGNRTGMVFLDKEGNKTESRNKVSTWKWSKLPDGMIQELRYNLAGEETVMNPFCPFFELRFSYNDKGFVTRMANYKADTLYNCTAENCGDIGVSYFSFAPNENGDVEKFEVFNVFGQMSNLYWGWSKRMTSFDENGYAVETVVYDQDNELVGGKLIPVTVNKYDEHGALIESRSLDKNRNLVNNPQNGVAVTQYLYDEQGQRTETLSFDKDNNPVKAQG